MKHITTTLFLLSIFAIAQENGTPNGDETVCETLNHNGFISVTENSYNEVYNYVKDSTFSLLHFAVDVSGTIDTVFENYNNVLSLDNQNTSAPLLGITEHKITRMKTISITNRKLTLPASNDSSMIKKFKAHRVFIPKSLPAKVGDFIVIKNYAAILNDTCYAGESTHQKALVYGEYTLNPQPQLQLQKNIRNKPKHGSARNRDANGKYTTKRANNSILY